MSQHGGVGQYLVLGVFPSPVLISHRVTAWRLFFRFSIPAQAEAMMQTPLSLRQSSEVQISDLVLFSFRHVAQGCYFFRNPSFDRIIPVLGRDFKNRRVDQKGLLFSKTSV